MPGEKAEFSFCQKIYIQNVNVFLFCDSPPNAPLSVKAVWDNPGRNMGHFFRISLFNSHCGGTKMGQIRSILYVWGIP